MSEAEDESAPTAGTERGAEGRSEKTRREDSNAPRRRRRDFKAIAAAALAVADSVVSRWAADGKPEGHEWVCLNPRRGDTRLGSFRVNLRTGSWADFATDDAKGGDLVSWVAYLEGCGQAEAADKLAAFLGMERPDAPAATRSKPAPTPAAGVWVHPVPADAPRAPATHPRHGKPSAQWIYRDRDGCELFRVLRFDHGDGSKEVLPLHLRREQGALRWRFGAPPEPRPLYGLDRLGERPGALVLVTEGEKAADAGGRMFADYVTVTSPGGAKAADKADWSALKGRAVLIWPDADKPGEGYARAVARLVQAAGAQSVAVLKLAALAGLRGAELPAGFDAADAEAEGMAAAALVALFADSSSLEQAGKPKGRGAGASHAGGVAVSSGGRFDLIEEDEPGGRRAGVYWVPLHRDREGGIQDGAPEWLCGPLRVVALARDGAGDRWGPVLAFRTAEGRERTWAMPAAWAAGDGREAREALLDRGLQMTTDGRRRARLLGYIMEARPACFARAAERTGWHGAAFVLPSGEVIGDPGPEPLILQGASGEGARLATAGTLAAWTREVAAPCVPHARLVLSVSLAFGALLLGLAGQESGGLHLRGGSSLGKSSALALAASVFGSPAPGSGYLRSWRATDNALEAVASHHSGLLLCLDELAELAPSAAAAAGYMLGNGQGKGRSRRDGSPRPPATWSLLFFSAGELGLSDLIAQTGGRTMAGQEVRLIDMPADAGAGFGILSAAPSGMSAGAFVERLRAAAMANHGHAARAFLAVVAAQLDTVRELVGAFVSTFVRSVAGDDATGQVRRVAGRFGLIACGGMLATRAGLTGWSEYVAEEAARRCFADWLAARGTRGALEPAAILRAVRAFIESHGEARFSAFDRGEDDRAPRTLMRCGWRKRRDDDNGFDFLIFPEAFRREVVAGFDFREAARVLLALGVLLPDSEGTATRQERMPDKSRMRVYRICGPELWAADV